MSKGDLNSNQLRNQKSNLKAASFVKLWSSSKADRMFFVGAIKGLLPFQHDLRPFHTAGGRPSPFSKYFFGLCLAAPSNDNEVDAVVSLVKQSGVGSVRFDYSYGQDSKYSSKLLRTLNQSGIEVLLHLVQPLESAEQMPKAAYVNEWKSFLELCFKQFEGSFKAVEVGTTINRVKWSGYNIEGFLSMWSVAYEFFNSHKIELVGPNVTDFEPQYNAGVLSILKSQEKLPSIHSNNLFSERSIEPEAVDHKILGKAFRWVHGFDLRKKIALISSISKKSGVTRNWSTCAFWTIPRVKRLWKNEEYQVADYLARYFVICASTGRFERIFWGPLVSFREGLVDDGTEDRASSDGRDVVSFYSSYPGEVESWRIRPAFHTLEVLITSLSGFSYEAPLNVGKGLEIHEFRKGTEALVIAWTINGRLARLRDSFSQSCISNIRSSLSCNGSEHLETPDFINQSPQIFKWEHHDQIELLQTAKLIKKLTIAPASAGFKYYDLQSDGWTGIISAETREQAKQLHEVLHPKRILKYHKTTNTRNAEYATWTIEHPLHKGQQLLVNKEVHWTLRDRILRRNNPAKALSSWNGTSELMRRGIETPKAIAYFECNDSTRKSENLFICENLSGCLSVHTFFANYAKGDTRVEGLTFDEFTHQLISFVTKIHSSGVFFRNLRSSNVLVQILEHNQLVFSLINTSSLSCQLRGAYKRYRMEDLKRLTHDLTSSQRNKLISGYLSIN